MEETSAQTDRQLPVDLDTVTGDLHARFTWGLGELSGGGLYLELVPNLAPLE